MATKSQKELVQRYIDSAMAQPNGPTPAQAARAKVYADQYGLSNAELAGMSRGRYTVDQVNNTSQDLIDMNQAPAPEMYVPYKPENNANLASAESAINDALIRSRNALNSSNAAAQARIQQSTGQATNELAPYAETGVQANEKLAGLQGLLGVETQQQAFDDYQAGPEQAYLTEQASRNAIGNASATGGLGGGDVRRELQRQAIGLAAQDFGNYSARLENTRAGGQGASAGRASLYSTGGLSEGQILANQGRSLAELESGAGSAIANARLGTSQLLGDQTFQSGLQQAAFNQQNRVLGASAIGAGGSDISTQIANAARASGNVNLSDAQIQNMLTSLGINATNPALQGRSDILGAGQLAGANQAADTGMAIMGMI